MDQKYKIIEDSHVEIYLTRGTKALIDLDDLDLILSMGKWHISDAPPHGYARTRSKGKFSVKYIRMHRLVMDCPPGLVVDHKNWDKLDNRKSNLRRCTKTDNTHNVVTKIINPTGYRGVHLTNSGKFKVKFRYNNKQLHGGVYDNPIFAATRYDELSFKYLKEYAILNFPEDYKDRIDDIKLKYKEIPPF